MSFFDALFGRTKLKRPHLDPLFRLAAAAPDIEGHGYTLERRAGVCVRTSEEAQFDEAWQRAVGVARLYAQEHALKLETPTDDEGYCWVVLTGEQFDDIVTGLHATTDTIGDAGYGGELLAALFRLQTAHGAAYLIYNYKRGKFYPFWPQGSDRNEARELQVRAALDAVLPFEEDLGRWYPLWKTPV